MKKISDNFLFSLRIIIFNFIIQFIFPSFIILFLSTLYIIYDLKKRIRNLEMKKNDFIYIIIFCFIFVLVNLGWSIYYQINFWLFALFLVYILSTILFTSIINKTKIETSLKEKIDYIVCNFVVTSFIYSSLVLLINEVQSWRLYAISYLFLFIIPIYILMSIYIYIKKNIDTQKTFKIFNETFLTCFLLFSIVIFYIFDFHAITWSGTALAINLIIIGLMMTLLSYLIFINLSTKWNKELEDKKTVITFAAIYFIILCVILFAILVLS